MLKKIIKLNLAIFFLTTVSLAEVILDITVNGNKRISKETLIVFSEITKGGDYNSDDLNKALKNIYSTNFFKTVNLNVENSILNIEVVENPIISGVEINGIKSTKLNEFIFERISLKNRSSFIELKFKNDVNLVNNILKSSGYYFAEIKTKSILNEAQNSIQIIYDIDLGKKAKISQIQFLGDKKIKDRKLYGIITSEESRFWKFLSQSIYLNYDRIERDKRLLENYYKDSGYYNVNITNSFVEFSNEGQFKLIFNIDSGKKFTFNKLDLVLSEDYDSKYFLDIKKSLKKLENKDYSFSKMERVLREIDKIALTKQYEFINASLNEKIIGDNKLNVSITLVETDKFYIERINILGNSYTLEEVIRNTFIVDEGDAYNEILFNKSINLIKAKNIFSKVESKASEGSNPNYKVIDITVEEKATGEISLGAGVGSSGGTIGGGLRENNFLGKGIKLDTNLQLTANSVKGSFTHIKPNFNYTDNTLFTTVKSTETDNLADFGYKTTNIGFSLGTSFEQYENFYFQPELATSYEELETTDTASTALSKQKGDYLDTYFNYSLTYDLRDKAYRPEEGFKNQFYQEFPLISDNSEIVNSFETTKYKKFSKILTRISFYGKAVNTLSGDDVRISKRLYIPKNKLRGFENGKVGPVENLDYIGGNYVSAVNFNAALPELLPNFQNTDISFFIDAANIWGVDYNSSLDKKNKIRSATGLGLDIFTPIGPLSFSLSYPITKVSSDKTESFRFNLGTTF
jgi:outer membrane protein insertion porin family